MSWRTVISSSPATSRPTIRDLEWAAGFFQGEGSSGCYSGRVRVTAGNTDQEPVLRMRGLFGGSVSIQDNHGLGSQPMYIWRIACSRAEGFLLTMYALLSVRRRIQALKALRYVVPRLEVSAPPGSGLDHELAKE